MLDRLRLGFIDSILLGQGRGHGMQSVEGQLLRFAEIDPAKSSLTLAVGTRRTVKVPNGLRTRKIVAVCSQPDQAEVPTRSW